MQKIKIAHIITSLEQGGAQQVLYTIVSQIPECEHIIFYCKNGVYVERFKAIGIRIYHIKGLISFLDPIAYIHLVYQLRRMNIDKIHGLLWAGNLLARVAGFFLRLPVFLSLHNRLILNGSLRTYIDRFTQVGKPTYLAVTHTIADEFKSFYNLDKQRSIKVIENGIAIDEYVSLRSLSSKDSSKKNVFVFGAVGRLVAVKNYTFLIEVFFMLFQKYSFVRLHIVGSGPEELMLTALIKKRGLTKVVFLHTNKSAKEFYPLFDCFVQPSLNEGLSLALLEAMAACIPVVVAGAQHELIIHQVNGLIANAHDKLEFFSTLEWVLQQTNQLIFLAQAGQLVVKNNYCSEKMTQAYKSIFQMGQKNQ